MLTKHILCYRNFFKNKNIPKKLKLRLKNTIIDKVLTYESETWTLTKQLNVFERKVYRRILGPVYNNEKENWRILTNKEIYTCYETYYNRDNKVK
jgi:cell shape-determining protein MreC